MESLTCEVWAKGDERRAQSNEIQLAAEQAIRDGQSRETFVRTIAPAWQKNAGDWYDLTIAKNMRLAR